MCPPLQEILFFFSIPNLKYIGTSNKFNQKLLQPGFQPAIPDSFQNEIH